MGKGKRLRRERKLHEKPVKPLSKQEKKALHREINFQILQADEKYRLDMNAAVLWVLYSAFGFGKVRLRRFFDSFTEVHEELRNHYELEDTTNTWICRHLLKEQAGVDLEQWEKETENNDD